MQGANLESCMNKYWAEENSWVSQLQSKSLLLIYFFLSLSGTLGVKVLKYWILFQDREGENYSRTFLAREAKQTAVMFNWTTCFLFKLQSSPVLLRAFQQKEGEHRQRQSVCLCLYTLDCREIQWGESHFLWGQREQSWEEG